MKTLVLVALAAALVPATATAPAEAGPAGLEAREATLPTLKVRTTRFGKILFAGNGRVVYGTIATSGVAMRTLAASVRTPIMLWRVGVERAPPCHHRS